MKSRTAQEIEQELKRVPDLCPLCGVVARGVAHYIDTVFYELVTDRPTREAIRKAGGFCAAHARAVERQADALGTSLIFADILSNEVRGMDDGRWDRPPNTVGAVARILDGSLPSRGLCPVCREERGQEEIVVDSLCEGLRDPELAALWGHSGGLCLPHFRLAFLRCRDSLAWRRILDVERRSLAELERRLQELARRFDYRSADAPDDTESDVWRQALRVTSGRLE